MPCVRSPCPFPLQLSTAWEAPGWDKRLFVRRGKPEVGEMAGESTSEEEETRCDTTRSHIEKPGSAGKAPPFHAGFCYFQVQFCFDVTSNPTTFQTLLHKGWLGSRSIHLVEPQTKNLGMLSALPAWAGAPQGAHLPLGSTCF